MRKELPNESNRVEVGLAYLRGRIEAQAELSKAIGVLQIELTSRMGELFSSPEALRQVLGIPHSVPDLRVQAAERASGKRTLASSNTAPVDGLHTRSTKAGKLTAAQKLEKRRAADREAKRRSRVAAKEGRKLTRGGRPVRSKEERAAQQKIYATRSAERQAGKSEAELTPLPSPTNRAA
jgi:hypothetical protein